MPRTPTLLIGANLLLAALVLSGLGSPPVAAQPFPPPGLPSHPNAAVQEHMRRGNDAMSRGHWEVAVAAYTQALRIDPDAGRSADQHGHGTLFSPQYPCGRGRP